MTSHGCSRDIVPLILSTSRANIHHMRPTEWWPFKQIKSLEMLGICQWLFHMYTDGLTLLLQGIAMSTYLKGESVLHRAMVGMLTYDASVNGWWSARGSVTIKSRGSLKAAWIWLVNVPGVNRPWKVVAPVAAANFRTALYRMTKQFTYVLHFDFVTEVWLRSISIASHKTEVLMALVKTLSTCFSTLPTPRHWQCCLALTVCTLSNPRCIYKFTCPVFLEEMTQTSAGFSMATMALAARSSFSQVFFKLMMYTPKEWQHRLFTLG